MPVGNRSGHKTLAVLLALCAVLVEYSIYGLLLVFVLRLMETHRVRGVLLYVVLTTLYAIIAGNPVQFFAILALPVLWFCPVGYNLQVPNWLWRWFYPVHFIILAGVQILCVH